MARTSSSAPSRDRAATRPGALVRPGLTARPLPAVEFDVRTVFDFLLSMCNDCGVPEELLPEDRAWLEENRASLLLELRADKSACDACGGFAVELSRLLPTHPEVRTARQLVELVSGMSDREFLEIVLGELVESEEFGADARRALDGDADAFARLQAHLETYKGHPVLTVPLAQLAPGIRRILAAWLPHFEPVEDRIGRMLERDVSTRNAEAAAADPLAFVEQTTNGIRLVPEPHIGRIVLAPSYFTRPFNSLTRVGEVQLIGYPIADAALGAAGGPIPPASAIRLYRALGDETRLRILHLLAERARYLTELANELDLSKPTVSHHMAQLRSAGLVTTTDQGNMTYFTLRKDRVEEAGPELAAYLAGYQAGR
jgi:DNA-binding transcriptional ArsR family regulator